MISALAIRIQAAADGDEDAWRWLVAEFRQVVRRSAARIDGLTREDLDDVEAATWLRLVTRISSLRTPEAIAGWLSTTAYREALHVRRSHRPTVELDDPAVASQVRCDPDHDESLMCQQIRQTMLGLLDQLSPTGQRLLVTMLDDPDASYRDIEARTGVGVSSIGPIRRRVLTTISVSLDAIGISTGSSTSGGS